ncbi:MAG: hypothetical protein U0176_05105 [Bacteroidia bacterium]
MNTTHQILNEVLLQIHPNKVPQPQKDALNTFKQEVTVFLQQHYRLRDERVGDPFAGGSQAKGTDIALGYDLDLFVPFKHGFRGKPQAIKADLLNTLRARFAQTGVEVRDQRVSVGLRKLTGMFTLQIDVVPGMELEKHPYQHNSDKEEDKNLILYDRESSKERTTNVARQIRLIKNEMTQYRDTVRLLKAWRHKHDHILGSYALELLVYRASKLPDAPKNGSHDVLLRHVLKQSIPFLEKDGELQDIGANYKWPDYLKPGAKTQLAGLWKKLLAALDGKDMSLLRSFFP